MNTIQLKDVILSQCDPKISPNFFSSSCLELDNFDTLLREEHIGLSEAADIMTCLCPICLPLKTPLSTKLDNFCFNSRLRDENGGHTFSLTSAEKLLIFCSRLGTNAALRAADLDWIVRLGFNSGGYILGCWQCLASCLWHLAWIGPDLLCHLSYVIRLLSSATRRPSFVLSCPSSVIWHLSLTGVP